MAAKILIIDDDAAIRAICTRVLRLAGHDVDTGESGEAGVARLGEGWDIILTDVFMPGSVDGIAMIRLARTQADADVILITGAPGLDSAVAAIREGAYDYLVKPFTPSELLVSVNRCLEHRRLSEDLKRERALRAELGSAYQKLSKMDRLRETFGQFVTPEVANFVIDGPDDVWTRGERKDVTAVFVDVRKFTSFAEGLDPEKVVEALNQVFACVSEAIHLEGGIVNKFIGDGMLAIFGAPVPLLDHPAASARAALRVSVAIGKLAETRKQAGLEPLQVGIGVNTGTVIASCLGTALRAEYSVIGHAVNLASRLESEAEPGQILLGPETVSRLGERFRFGLRSVLVFPGIKKPVIVTELLSEVMTERNLASA